MLVGAGGRYLYAGAPATYIEHTTERPAKDAANPIFGNAAWTWDRDINYAWVLTDAAWPVASRYRIWYNGVVNDASIWSTCYAYSVDGVNWTKPTVGHINYGGNTNNNILIARGVQGSPCYDAGGVAGRQYLLCASYWTGGNVETRIYGSDDDTPTGTYTLLKTVRTHATRDPQFMVRRASDSKYLIYYQDGYSTQDREIGVLLSDTNDLTGAWTDQGIVIANGGNQDDQRYSISVGVVGATYYAFVTRYVKTNEQIDRVLVYTSTDGLTWALADSDWLDIGAAGAWDDEMILSGLPVRVGSDWWVYYSGFAEDHAHALPRSAYVGISKLQGHFIRGG